MKCEICKKQILEILIENGLIEICMKCDKVMHYMTGHRMYDKAINGVVDLIPYDNHGCMGSYTDSMGEPSCLNCCDDL